jgi:hypothetical protein
MSALSWDVTDREKAKMFCQYVTEQAEEGIDRTYSIIRSNRSTRQHNALHLLFRQLATGLNDAGFMQKHPFNEEFEIPWSENSIKEMFFKPIIEQMYGIKSTRKLGTTQLSESANAMIDAINMKLGVFVPFPSMSEHL